MIVAWRKHSEDFLKLRSRSLLAPCHNLPGGSKVHNSINNWDHPFSYRVNVNTLSLKLNSSPLLRRLAAREQRTRSIPRNTWRWSIWVAGQILAHACGAGKICYTPQSSPPSRSISRMRHDGRLIDYSAERNCWSVGIDRPKPSCALCKT